MKKFIALLILLAFGFIFYFYGGAVFKKLDRNSPIIALSENLPGLGFDPREVEFSVVDGAPGLQSVSISAEQNGKTVELFKQDNLEGNEQTLKTSLSGRGNGLVEGPLTLTFRATDRSFFHNKAVETRSMIIDYAKPKVQVLTQQFRMREAGAEFIIFRAQDSNLSGCGVRVGNRKYPAVPASDVDPAFAAQKDIYAALFALPFSSIDTDHTVSIFADDAAGNETLVPLYLTIDPFKQTQVTPRINESFVNQKIDELIPSYEKRSGKIAQIDRSNEQGLAHAFITINEEYRSILEKILVDKMTKDKPSPIQWSGIFIKPMPSATSSTLGEMRHYFLNNTDAGKSIHAGLDLASVENDSVRAANNGTIVLAEEFGIYGNAVLIDHGLGVYSLYGHLSSIQKNPGDQVKKGEEIGRSGRTGLAGGDHLHFETRIRGMPVTPIEWWDEKWMQDDFYGKIAGVKESLSGNP